MVRVLLEALQAVTRYMIRTSLRSCWCLLLLLLLPCFLPSLLLAMDAQATTVLLVQ